MAETSNVQAALAAAAVSLSSGYQSGDAVLSRARSFLAWMDDEDAARARERDRDEDDPPAAPDEPLCAKGNVLAWHTQPCAPGCNYPAPADG